jgi:Skp family chaperone for outer membrane proteins
MDLVPLDSRNPSRLQRQARRRSRRSPEKLRKGGNPVKKLMLILLALGLFGIGAGLGPLFSGQVPKEFEGKAPTPKILIVNVTAVIERDGRRKKFRADLLENNADFKAKVNKLEKEIDPRTPGDLDISLSNDWSDNEPIRKKRQELENLYREAEQKAGKKYEQFMTVLWRDMELAIRKCAECYGHNLAIAYGDPADQELRNGFPNINRKMVAMDSGDCVPLYVHCSADITDAVAETMLRWARYQKKSAQDP